MSLQEGKGNFPTRQEHPDLEREVENVWRVWKNQDLIKQMKTCLAVGERKDLQIANEFAAYIVRNNEYFVVNIAKNTNVNGAGYTSRTVSAPNLETDEQRRAYFGGVV